MAAASTEARPRLALVTGGCRRVGAAIAARLAKAEWQLALHGHSDAEPEAELAALLEEKGTRWHGFIAELSDGDAPAALIGEVTAHFGRAPDLLVNSASIFEYDDWESLDAASLSRFFSVNAFAPILLARELVAAAGEGAQPAIVHILDQRIFQPNGDQLGYLLSKQALGQSVKTLARAFGARARVNGVAPGLTLPTGDYDAEQMRRLEKMMPLEVLPDPDDIADAVAWLAEAGSVTGQIVCVDGGAHLKSFARDFMFLARGKDGGEEDDA